MDLKDSKNKKFKVFNFPGSGTALTMYNLDDSIKNFARACMNYGLGRKWPVYLSTKNTILKAYDGRFKDLSEVLKKSFLINLKKLILIMNMISGNSSLCYEMEWWVCLGL